MHIEASFALILRSKYKSLLKPLFGSFGDYKVLISFIW